MIEFDPSKNLELSQETLKSAWHDLAESLMLRPDTIAPLVYELPPSEGDPQPCQFTVQLPDAFAQKVLLEDDDRPQTTSATYIMEHRVDDRPEYPETYEVVTISWSHMLGDSSIRADRNMTISLVRAFGEEEYKAETFVEYVEFRGGKWHRISPNGYDFSGFEILETHSEEWYRRIDQGFEDFEASEGVVALNDIEKVHKIAEYIRHLEY